MARAKGWYTVGEPSGSVGVTAAQADRIIAENLVNPTVLRTRAFAALAYANPNIAPYYPGNSLSPQVFRVLLSDAASPPDPGWPAETSGPDDVIFDSLIWYTQFYVPASLDLTRPESIFAVATPAGGICDSAGQRTFPGGSVDVRVDWYTGPAPDTGAVADPLFTVHTWIRCLIESTI